MGQLDGRRALILGGANGIGRAAVALFAAEGAQVIFGDVDAPGGEAVAAEQRALGHDVTFRRCDCADVADIRAFVAAAGVPDAALYCSGIIRPGPFLTLTEADYDDVVTVNVKGAVFFFQAAAAAMIAAGQGGTLTSISSIGGFVATDSTHAYGVSKAGLIHLAKSLAVSLAAHGIRANTVAPGGVDTPMQAHIPAADRRASLSRTPMLRLARPEEIARVALFLASDASSYVTGETICADGGRLALHRTVAVPEGAGA